ncbi:MAG: TIGR00374 family protein [Salinivirgaceae bacterium]|nr:MAG: TIGR00374 family protein [Salinivirgaceae bacterium]
MKKKIINAIKFLVFISLGIFIFWKVYEDQDVNEIIASIQKVDFAWVYLSIFIGILSHIARSARWVLLANSLGYKPSQVNSFFAVMITYFANLAFPRLGEVSRPAVLKRYEKIPLSTALGTIITERIIDIIILLSITVLGVLIQFDVFDKFLTQNPSVSEKLQKILDSGWIIGGIMIIGIIALILFFVFRNKFNHINIFKKLNEKVDTLKEGLLSIRKVKSKILFIIYSLLIWIFYYLMIYVCFYSFDFLESFGLVEALALFVLGSYGMVAPVQGGIGAYHFMIISGLMIYGINESDAGLFALVVWSAQTLMIIGLGFISYISLPFYNKYRKHEST